MSATLYIWIPRTAGTSLCKWAANHMRTAVLDPKGDKPPYHQLDRCGFVTFQHASIPQMVANRMLHPEDVVGLFSFGVVRNPWDRFVSFVSHVTQSRNRTFGNCWNDYLDRLDGFLTGRRPRKCLSSWSMPSINPQLYWLSTRRGLFPNAVCQFEYLTEHLAKLAPRLGWPTPRLDTHNASTHGDYRDYFDRSSRELVGRWFDDDVKFGGYTFDKPQGHGFFWSRKGRYNYARSRFDSLYKGAVR